ncbi:MAG: hypothetical protein HUU46_01300 [Candidatus Hydrogenedentes bacterium]|nr:hypothetical protein [Candidatus Hydrogenedentota bacterium]
MLRRAAALLEDIQAMDNSPDLRDEARALRRLAAIAGEIAPNGPKRGDLFAELCALKRKIALRNPLLDFERIVFLKHNRARYEHMVDQYYGFHAERGGGVFVLDDAFGNHPSARDVVSGVHVENGRLRGKPLENGSFISLELSYDAQQILFAWTEAQVPVTPTDRTPMTDLWNAHSTYHVFSAVLAGSGLRQLTDGPSNDFDPCYLPNGRICFVSERRGGFLRCGIRPNPTYTLHDMRADGSDIRVLSFHETHEWHPSVNNDGMIVYTRWDYVDRDSDMAHHLWLTYPDGRDPRTSHGNYPAYREARPWMEMSIRAVPNSRKYVAVAAPHHGQAYGSLVLIDLSVPDDGAMAQIKRITPDVAFPESEEAPGVSCETHRGRNNRKSEVYGTPWPLNENYYLCVYDRGQKNYGICLVDAFGNRELLYRDPAISCLDPIPLRARSTPPVLPTTIQSTTKSMLAGLTAEPGYLAVMNIYDSARLWPKDTPITALRVVQLFPKTTPAQDEPNIGVGNQSLARGVVTTAPVEADGSVYCEVPAGVPIYFQALDAKGRAVQSMCSDTYVHPGETLTCAGCHESKQSAGNALLAQAPLAMRRPPSPLKPDVEGSYPVSFPRLVQPVLNSHCTACHENEKTTLKLDGNAFGKWGWSESYHALSRTAWARHGGNGSLKIDGRSYSVPGEIGARASPLLKMLEGGHYGVTLPPDALYRITLWLDCNSVFYGAYDRLDEQARGAHVVPSLF